MSLVVLALLGLVAQDPGQWQDFGKGPDGAGVALNVDSVITGEKGPEAMVRVRYARATAQGAAQGDYLTTFNCTARTATRLLMGERDAAGEIVSRYDEGTPAAPVQAPAGTPMGQVLDQVCEMAAS
jgi:hypothetical protein